MTTTAAELEIAQEFPPAIKWLSLSVALPQKLHGPRGLAVGHGAVWIADTDAHAVLRLDVASGTLQHIPIGE